MGSCCPETLTKALEKCFLETGDPENLTLIYAAAQGNRDGSGADHFAHERMVKRVIVVHWNMVPQLGTMVIDNKIEGYNLLQGTISGCLADKRNLYRPKAWNQLSVLRPLCREQQ